MRQMLLLLLVIMILLAGCRLWKQPETTITVHIFNRDGDDLGKATLTEESNGIKLKLDLKGLPSGYHGLHIHEKAACDPPKFESTGNHFNPDDKEHGLLHPKGAHLGDLPNIEADGSGKVDVELFINEATLLRGKNSLTDKEGTAIIITENPDDGMTQISGNSGERIACGKIKRKI